jgi:DNA-binding transcriptional regulator YdaS (Cro superfamily)
VLEYFVITAVMTEIPTRYEALCAATEIAGGQTGLARICGCSQPAVWKMLRQSKQLSTEFVLVVERETGVPKYYLRPDIYPIPPNAKLELLADIVARWKAKPKAAPRRRRRTSATAQTQAVAG